MPSRRLFILLVGFLSGLSPFAIDTYLPSLPTIAEDLMATPATVQLSISVFLAFFAIPQLFFGPVSDAIGRRPTVLIGLVCYIAGSAVCGLAPSIAVLLMGRAIQAIGASALAVSVPALVRDRYAGADYTSTMGFIMMVMAIAPLFAPIFGSVILTIANWRWIFIAMLIVACLCAFVFAKLMTESLPKEKRVPFNPQNLFANYRKLFSGRHCVGLALTSSFIFGGLMTFITSSPFVYIELYGVPAEYFGFLFAINVLVLVAVTYINSRLVYRVRSELLLRTGIGCVTVASILLFLLSVYPKPPLLAIIVATAFYLANLGLITANVMGILMTRFATISGATSAMTGTLRFGVAALAGALVAALHSETSQALTFVMGICGVLVLTSYLAAGKTPR